MKIRPVEGAYALYEIVDDSGRSAFDQDAAKFGMSREVKRQLKSVLIQVCQALAIKGEKRLKDFMGKNLKKRINKKLIDRQTTTLDKFLEFNPNKPEDTVEFHKYKLLFQLNEFMLRHNISKADLARKLHISRQAVTNKFIGETLTLDWIVRAFTVLGVGLEMKQSSRSLIAA